MTLQSLEVTDFRCITHARVELDQRCTLITGANGSGKTSLLEAIHVLSCGHSFRTSRQELLVRQGAEQFMAVGRVDKSATSMMIGVRGSRDKTEAHLGGQQVQGFAELAALFPTQVIDPEVHRLLEDGPKARRKFLDWGVFHVEPSFVDAWRRYQRALRQRNAALKAKQPRATVTIWDSELVESGAIVSSLRQRYVENIQGIVARVAESILALPVQIEHRCGWNRESSLSQALEEVWLRDQRNGLTTVGPHRADLIILVSGAPAKERISRGQQKLLAAALLLAQFIYRVESGGEPACLLLDDPAAELDVDNLKKLLLAVAEVPAQLIVTSLDLRHIDQYLGGARFHVERGRVSPML